jgi:hypothetical protein
MESECMYWKEETCNYCTHYLDFEELVTDNCYASLDLAEVLPDHDTLPLFIYRQQS